MNNTMFSYCKDNERDLDIAIANNNILYCQFCKISNNLGETIRRMREAQKISQLDLAIEAGIDEKTIRRIEGLNPPKVKIETLIAICIALRLYPAITRHILFLAGYILVPNNEKSGLYTFIIDVYYRKGIDECNELLIRAGFNPLTNHKRGTYAASASFIFFSRDFFSLYIFQLVNPVLSDISSVDSPKINIHLITVSSFFDKYPEKLSNSRDE